MEDDGERVEQVEETPGVTDWIVKKKVTLATKYTSMGSGHDFACSVRSGRKSCQGDIINKVPKIVFKDNENANQNMLC